MVSQIADGSLGCLLDRGGRPFRRRNTRPAAYALAATTVLTALLWAVVLTRPSAAQKIDTCNPPPLGSEHAGLGTAITATSMIDTTPMKPADTRVHVLNASGVAGQAADIADALRDLGFVQAEAGNDPVYSGARLTCSGQIRFGEAGKRAAATVWLVAPCSELYRDDRDDNSIDLAVGTGFVASRAGDDIEAVLAALNGDSIPDSTALNRIRSTTC